MAQMPWYEKPVLLNREKHRDRRIRAASGFSFARKANSLYLAGVEFNEACKEYAIVFTRLSGGKLAPVVVLGLRSGENLFIDEQERWKATYVPAFVRRYPFVLAELPGQQMGVCIDEGFEGVNTSEGDALFDAQGNNTPYLQNALEFLQRYQAEYVRTQAFCSKLEEAGLLTEMSARADLVDGRSFTVAGLMVVDEKKLMALPDATVLSLFRAGELHLVSMHLLSLSNLQRLVDRMAQRGGAAVQAAPKPA
ncbi:MULTISPECIES: SapC family protein [Ramlibacter]|uniref:SapC family protein n=1 Tax=Ramlibacter pinisoli TaxID=2682844 RepID=A0A6N8IYR1_9BURK|nr:MULTISPECIES: SapC family protein [Ramlibacter]MBA2962227.1 SapC family protein [Ramlibacter sp. CGMCC 1.13660]MVQ32169.1 SapC family protein [Ramlibacter pinisoli]